MGAVTQQPRNWIWIVATATLVVGWLALFLGNRAVLVWYNEPREKVGMLECNYFTGTGFVERKFLFSQNSFLGRDTCPRVIQLK